MKSTVRAYRLRLYPNPGKAEAIRYAMWWYRAHVLAYIQRYYSGGKRESTARMGLLPNQAQSRAWGVVRAGFASEKATGKKFSCPTTFPLLCEGTIRASNNSTFPYWIKTPLGPYVPAKPHRRLNAALRMGGTLTSTCEVKLSKSGIYTAVVFVRLKIEKPQESADYLGCDVGVNAGVARSDGYIGASLAPILKRSRDKRAEQHRQRHRTVSARSSVKQLLDREAKRVVASAKRGSKTLVLERSKTLGNLKPRGSIGGWARRHFGERVRQIAEISSVAVKEVWPAYTSITCLKCGHRDKANRRGISFRCTQCGAIGHADVVAAINLTRRARGVFLERPKGRVTNTNHGRRRRRAVISLSGSPCNAL
jgi:hypothetical protein